MRKRTLISGAVIVLFLGLLTAFPLSWYLLPEEARQQTGENRALAEFPSLSSPEDVEAFPAAFDTWYSDHLPYKEKLVEVKSRAEVGLFQQLDSDQVILGTEMPWLFYKANDGQAIETYKRTNQFSDENLSRIREVLLGFQEQLSEAGIDFVLMIVPDKETIYGPDYMPEDIKVMKDKPHRTEQLIAYMAEEAPELRILYPRDEMFSEKEAFSGTGPLYYESDTHWNKLGASVAAEALFRLLAEANPAYGTPEPSLTFSDLGDGSEAWPAGEPMKKTGDMQKLCKLPEAYDSREFRVEGAYPGKLLYEIKSPAGEAVYEQFQSEDSRCGGGRLYLAGDSFRWNLTDFVRGRAAESVICSRYYLEIADVLAQQPDTFVYMIAERYLHELEGLPGVAAPALAYGEDFVRTDYR